MSDADSDAGEVQVWEWPLRYYVDVTSSSHEAYISLCTAEGFCTSAQWLLGFVDEADPAALLRHRFPSKVGGRPVRYMRSAVKTCMFVP